MKSLQDIHIGSIIKEKVEEQKLSVSEFARKISCDRTNVYYIYECKTIDTELLITISKVLNYDFYNKVYFDKDTNLFEKKVIPIKVDKETLKDCNNIEFIIEIDDA